MYSEKLSALFSSLKASVGDLIKVEKDGLTFEGELMPQTEASNPDSIIIKLKNGYNAGIIYGPGTKVTRLGTGKQVSQYQFEKQTRSPKLPNVSILWVGGTIGSRIDYKTSGVSMTVKPEELLYYVPEIAKVANISIDHLFSIASEDLTSAEWIRIAEGAAKALNDGARGVVIAHGTDTMHYTASALSFMLGNLNAPVVLTGSQRSGDRGSSDAFFNLAGSVRIAAESNIAEVGICMHGSSSDDKLNFIRGTKARKMHTSRRDAFRPINDKAIANIDWEGKISYSASYRRIEQGKKTGVELRGGFEQEVALVKAYPNSDPGIIDYYVGKGCKGIIIEGTGLGHTPVSTEHSGMSWLGGIKAAVDRGVIVGMTSQCLYGRVNPNVYKNLRLLSGAGVVYCEDMLPETAYVKLGWLLGNYDAEKARELLSKNLVGEIKERTEFDEFLV